MRIDDLFIILLHLSEHRIQRFRKVLHVLIDLKMIKTKIEIEMKRTKWKSNQLNVMFFEFVIEHSINWLHHNVIWINVINSLVTQ